MPFNRTSLELKPSTMSAMRKRLTAFNRTSLELKLTLGSANGADSNPAFNRTSLELKHVWRLSRRSIGAALLIAPVWN